MVFIFLNFNMCVFELYNLVKIIIILERVPINIGTINM